MTTTLLQIDRLRDSMAPFLRFFDGPIWARREDADVASFAVGNPHETPLIGCAASRRAALRAVPG